MKIQSQGVALPKSAKNLDWEDKERVRPLYVIAAQMRLQNQIEAFKAGLIDRDEVEVDLLKVADSEPEKVDAHEQHLQNAEELAAISEIKADIEMF